ncbi:hypothetical protein [Pseudonocardia sp.]|uniref:hypothetical protein n=1 Tax=Pseudonocardia sp. TaxID=60912 RepID=UPI00262C40B0|nr:hypothetical protein [Pseudonocardia sp.]
MVESRRRGNPAVEVSEEVGGPVVGRPSAVAHRIARAALVAAVAVVATLAVGVVVRAGPAPATVADGGSVALAGWLQVATDPATTIAVADPALRAELLGVGVPAARLAEDGRLVVVAAAPGPTDLARFGDLSVRDRDGATAPRPDSGLADNPRLVAAPEVREVIRAGTLDERAMAVLAGLAGRGPVTVSAVPALPGETSALPRHTVVLEGLDTATQDWLRAQRGPYAPVIDTSGAETTLSWPVPARTSG